MGKKSTKMGHSGHFRGMKRAKNGRIRSFLRSEVWPRDQILAQKNPAHKNLNPAKIELIPAQLGKFLGSKVGQFWRSGGLRGPLRKSKMQKNFIPAQNIFISAQNILIPAQNITIQGNPVYYTTR